MVAVWRSNLCKDTVMGMCLMIFVMSHAAPWTRTHVSSVFLLVFSLRLGIWQRLWSSHPSPLSPQPDVCPSSPFHSWIFRADTVPLPHLVMTLYSSLYVVEAECSWFSPFHIRGKIKSSVLLVFAGEMRAMGRCALGHMRCRRRCGEAASMEHDRAVPGGVRCRDDGL